MSFGEELRKTDGDKAADIAHSFLFGSADVAVDFDRQQRELVNQFPLLSRMMNAADTHDFLTHLLETVGTKEDPYTYLEACTFMDGYQTALRIIANYATAEVPDRMPMELD
jgi:hypothetical protein